MTRTSGRVFKAQHRQRYRQIAAALAHHGLGYLISLLGLRRFVPLHRPGPAGRAPTRPEHLRLALEEVGTTFIKIGQILSTRADLLPPEYEAELAKLQDAAPAEPGSVIEAIIISELGRPIEQLFASFDATPLAAASIGQAHAATLNDGTEVVVKVRRPGVVEQVEEDLDILQSLAAAASRRWDLADQYDLVGIAQEFAQTLRAELDYVREGRNIERFAENFRDDPFIHIPRVHWDLSTARVLTLERVRGTKVSDLGDVEAGTFDRATLARETARVFLQMVFEDGFFHADPHPGNLLFERNGRTGLIDFGMVGQVDERTQEHLITTLLAVTSQDADQMVEAFFELGVARRRVDRGLLRQDLEHLLSRYYGHPLGELRFSRVIGDTLAVVRRHQLQLPPNLALLLKTLGMLESLVGEIDATFSLTQLIEPYARQLMLRRFAPRVWAHRAARATFDGAKLGMELPQHLRRLLGDLERGGIEVGMRPVGVEPLLRRLERLVNR